ncbi:MAG: gliding motility-associated C-terminal domain-containing protein [Flavobacteriales bacterium]|nr:gliding motility-associated C-terminal domain-containing protein [Flavobacteriales bacterium]
MQKIGILILLVICGNTLKAQNNGDCLGATPICANSYSFNQPLQGEGNDPNEINGNTSCLKNGEVDGAWFSFTVQNSGNLCFTITPNGNYDYDWAVYNLSFGGGSYDCSDIFNTPSLEVACNYSPILGPTGANGNTSGNNLQNSPCIAVNAGDNMLIYISNFGGSGTGFDFDIDPNTTADIFDNNAPQLDYIIDTIECGGQSISFEFDEKIKCSSVAVGDFTLTGPNGNVAITNLISIPCQNGFTYGKSFDLNIAQGIGPTGTYTLSLTGFVEDQCGNQNAGIQTLQFYVKGYDLNMNATNATCLSPDGTASVAANGGLAGYTYIWNDLNAQTTAQATGLSPDVYQVTVTDAAGCISIDSIAVQQQLSNMPAVSFVASSDATCYYGANGDITVQANGGTNPYSWTWSDGQVTPTATGLAPGTYEVIVSDSRLCNDTMSITIGYISNPKIAAPLDTTICIGGTASLIAGAFGGNPNYTYEWIGIQLGQQLNVSPAIPSSYGITARDALNCPSDTAYVNVGLFPALSVGLQAEDYVCQGDSVQILAFANGGNGQYQYQWSNGMNGNPVWTKVLNKETIYVTVSNIGCETPAEVDSATIVAASYPPVQFYSDKVAGCSPLEVHFITNNLINNYEYNWDFEESTQTGIDDTVLMVFNESGHKNISLEVVSDSGCRSNLTFTHMIEVFPDPEADFYLNTNTPSNINPRVNLLDQSNDALSWEWRVNQEHIFTEQNLSYDFVLPGLNYVDLKVYNAYGCSDSIQKEIFVETKAIVNVPSAFTPNGDGVNDIFKPVFEGIDDANYEFRIFNRWGDLVFYSNNVNTGWDGQFNGSIAKDGIYIYKLSYLNHNASKQLQSGHVNLLSGF